MNYVYEWFRYQLQSSFYDYMFPEEYPFFEAVPLDKSSAHRCAGFANQLEIGEAVKREKGAYAFIFFFLSL